MSPASAFLRFWWTDNIRDTFLSYVPRDELLTLRLACHDFSIRAAPLLFEEITITFRTSTFTKPARMAALARIGHHVRTLLFSMPHGRETFLPPLLNPVTGEETTYVYEPYIQPCRNSASRLSVPKYGSWEMTDLLIKQYSPLFHAAANVPAFVRALSATTNLKHLKVSCPGQEPAQRYRRSAVDYALISLRIAVERTELPVLDTLSLASVHPGAILYLNPNMGFGALPNSAKRWNQIHKLAIHMDSTPSGPNFPSDHFKLLHSYLQLFTCSLRRLVFRWHGAKGPSPLSLSTEPSLQVPSPAKACPRRCHLALRPLKFQHLHYMELENAVLDATQISCFIVSHRHTILEFNFEDVMLRTGTWDEALAPLTRISGNERWKQKTEEVMDVPLMLSPVGLDEGQMEQVLRETAKELSYSGLGRSKPSPHLGGFQKAGTNGKELFWGTPEHMKRFLRNSVFSWR
ncbi:hypothetical protein MMC08_000089 [Hypocenomyce scalaris]|nr:hypothetical protein [Hypocenomyce scalaris]